MVTVFKEKTTTVYL